MIILDTDVLSLLQRGTGREFERLLARLNATEDEVAVTIISFEEQMRGWLSYIAKAKADHHQVTGYSRLGALLEDFQTRPVLEYSTSAAAECQRLRNLKIRVGTMDLKIAAIAIARSATLVSRNLVDFQRVPGLHVEDWTT